MSHAVFLREAASADVQEAHDWYESKRAGLGAEFVVCVEETLHKLARWPDLGFIAYKRMRRAAVRRFPYGVFYVFDGGRIQVVGVVHGRRSPRFWKKRLE